MNIELLSKIKEQLRLRPLNFDMASYVDAPPEHPCGCTLCIGGWAIVLNEEMTSEQLLGIIEGGGDLLFNPQQVAADALKIPFGDSNRLFYVDAWPHPFEMDYRCANTPEEQVEVACRRIDHFIKTKD